MHARTSFVRLATVIALALLMVAPPAAAKSGDQNGNGGSSGHVGCQGDGWGYGLHLGQSGSANNSSIPIGVTLSCLLDLLALDEPGNTSLFTLPGTGGAPNITVSQTFFNSSVMPTLTAALTFSMQGSSAPAGYLRTTQSSNQSSLTMVNVTTYNLTVKDGDLFNDSADQIHAHLGVISSESFLQSSSSQIQIIGVIGTLFTGCTFDQHNNGAPNQKVELVYKYRNPFGFLVELTEYTYTDPVTGCFAFGIEPQFPPVYGAMCGVPLCPGGPYTFQVTLDPIGCVSFWCNPWWQQQVEALTYWSVVTYTNSYSLQVATSMVGTNYAWQSQLDYFSLIDWPNEPDITMHASVSENVESGVQYSYGIGGFGYSHQELGTLSWQSFCFFANGVPPILQCELGENDQLNFVGQLVFFGTVPNNGGACSVFPAPTGSCTQWTYAYEPVGGLVRSFAHVAADPFRNQDPNFLPPNAQFYGFYKAASHTAPTTAGITEISSTNAQDGIDLSVGVDLGRGISVSFAFSAINKWSSTTTTSVSWDMYNPNPNPQQGSCEEFAAWQDYSGSPLFGLTRASVHVYDTGLVVGC